MPRIIRTLSQQLNRLSSIALWQLAFSVSFLWDCNVLVPHCLGVNAAIGCYGDMLQYVVEDDVLDWVHICVENDVSNLEAIFCNEHLILAIAATSAFLEISEHLIVWGTGVR